MKKTARPEKHLKHPLLLLFLLYFCTACLRYLLTLAVSGGITVSIDESLYINLASSLFNKGDVLYRNQPISYVYLLYPLSLLPAFLMPAGMSLYRCVQAWNALLMNSMVFPAYFLGKKSGLRDRHALFISFVSILLPECFLSTHIVCESLIYPCLMWVFLLTAHVIEHPKKLWAAALLGALSGVLYFLKANCIVFGASFFVVGLLYTIVKKDKTRLAGILGGLVTLGCTIAAGYLLYGALFKDVSLLTLYEKQIPTLDLETILIMLQGTVYHLFSILFALGPVLCLFPFLAIKQMKEENKLFFMTLLVALLAMCVSIGVMIVPYRYTGTWYSCPTHTRYLAGFLPPIVAGLLLPELQRQRPTKKQVVSLCILSALYLIPSPFLLFTHQAGTYDSPSLNAFFAYKAGYVMGVLLLIALAAVNLTVILRLRKKGLTPSMVNAVCAILLIYMLVNNIYVYQNYFGIAKEVESEAQEAAEIIIDEEDSLIVISNSYEDIRSFQLDAHVRSPRHMVVMNNLLVNAVENGGCYRSFSPLVQSPNTASTPTPEYVDTLFFDMTCADYVEFTSDVVVEKTANGNYTIARIHPDRPWIKSAISHMSGYILYPQDEASLLIFDQEMLARGATELTITLYSYEGITGTMTIACNGQRFTIPITPSAATHTVELPITVTAFYHCTITTDVQTSILSYHTR